ncbi:MAG: fumarate hydratase [Desulfurococcaceae archaeon]
MTCSPQNGMHQEHQINSQLSRTILSLVNTVAVKLPDDVLNKLQELIARETIPHSRFIYAAMMENLNLAYIKKAPLCQDTGVLMFYITFGDRFPYKSELLKAIHEAVVQSTELGYLRPNVVDLVTNKNTGNNIGPRLPWIEIEIEPDVSYADVKLYMAGGGSSRPGRATTLDPVQGWKGLVDFILSVIAEYGPPACPPLLIGVGIGPTVEIAAALSKRALIRPIGSRNNNQLIAQLEELLEEELNKLKIGPQGLGGSTSIMGVHIEYAGRHPATFAVGVSTACWALRKGWIRINSDLSYEVLSHKGGLID